MATILDYLAAGDTCVLPAKRLCKALNQLGLSDATEDGIYDLRSVVNNGVESFKRLAVEHNSAG